MIWLWVVAVVVVIGVAAVLAAGRDSSMAEAYDDRPDRTIPSGRPLTADDLAEVRFSTAVRGYRMDEVDAFIDRLRADLIAREHVTAEAEVALTTDAAEATSTDNISVDDAAGAPGEDGEDVARVRRHGHAGWNADAATTEAEKLGLDSPDATSVGGAPDRDQRDDTAPGRL